MLQIKNLRKIYTIGKNKVIALDDVSFDLPNGKLVAIVGPSGCGKTTMMNLIGALDANFEGDVIVNGKSLKEAGQKDLDTYRKNTVGFIFQQFNLLNSLTSAQNVEIALDLSGYSKQDKVKKARILLERVGLTNEMKKKVNLMSGGQRQRVAIARALANDPEIILADEPTGALDVKTGEQVMELLREISKEKLVLMVTHAPELAKAYADLIVTMEDGKLISIEENITSVSTENTTASEKIETKSKMSFFTALKMSLRNAWLKKGRTIATAIGTSIGISGIALAIAITSGTTSAVNTQVNGIFPTNAITVGLKENTDKSIKDLKPIKYSDINSVMDLTKDIYAYNFQIEGVGVPVASFYSLDQSIIKDEKLMSKLSDQETREKLVMMMAPGVLDDVKNDIQYGALPKAGSTDEIVISLSTAKDLEKSGGELKDLIGKDIYVRYLKQGSNPTNADDANQVPVVRTWKIAGIANTTTLMDTYYATSDWAFNFYEKEFKIDKSTLETGAMVLYSSNDKNLEAQLKTLTDSQDKYTFDLTAKTISSQVDGAMKQVQYALLGFAGISILVAALMISIVVYISVLERIKEIGILRAVGARKRDILNVFVAESFIIGVLSAGIGLLFTLGISKVINSAVYSFLQNISENAPYMEVAKLPLSDAGLILLFCVVLSMISGFYPSLKASKMDPIDALRSR
jgi:putative ABC transport system permease protein